MKTNEEIIKIAASVPDSAFVQYQPTQAEAEPELPRALSFLEDSWRKLRKNKAAVVTMILLLVITALAFSAPVLSPFDPNEQHLSWKNLPPKWPSVQIDGLNGTTLFRGRRVDSYELAKVPEGQCFLFGTDEFGRDLLSRCLWGTRISLIIAFIAALLDLSIGIAYGLFSGMKGGRTDTVMQRTLEILSGIPSLVLVVLMLLIFEPGITSIILAMTISSWWANRAAAKPPRDGCWSDYWTLPPALSPLTARILRSCKGRICFPTDGRPRSFSRTPTPPWTLGKRCGTSLPRASTFTVWPGTGRTGTSRCPG